MYDPDDKQNLQETENTKWLATISAGNFGSARELTTWVAVAAAADHLVYGLVTYWNILLVK